MKADCVVRSVFDTDAFGFPYYRVQRFDETDLRSELDLLEGMRPIAIDAKCPAGDINQSHVLMQLGFRKVCMQVTLQRDTRTASDSTADVLDSLTLDEETMWRHAANFNRDRFSLDPLLPAAGRNRLYFNWLSNSLNGSKKVAAIGSNVCTFSFRNDEAVIDLVSILEPRRGHGRRLIGTVQAVARAAGARVVTVSTECENTAAWGLYQACSFLPAKYTAAFHLVRL